MKQLISVLCAPFFTNQPACLDLILQFNIVTKGNNSTLEVEDTEGVGSEFIIILPFKTNG